MRQRRILFRPNGSSITTTKVLGRGGEGEVHDLASEPNMVAKTYYKPLTPERSAKLEAMVRLGDNPLRNIAAWPIDVLREIPGGPVVGFLMPRLSGHYEIHKLSHPLDRLKFFRDVGSDFLVHVATNVARAFATLHSHGVVVGDVNESGIMVAPDGTVKLIDCDSMQLSVSGADFLCDVGKPEFQPPELQSSGISFRGLKRTIDHDIFGFAVLIFQLLFFGWHPFSVRMLRGDQKPLADNIANRRFAFARNFISAECARPNKTLAPEALPDYVMTLFEQAFRSTTARPSVATWVAALERLQSDLICCARYGTHWYCRQVSECPICRLEVALGLPILPRISLDARQLRLLWQQVEAVQSELLSPITASPPPQNCQLPVPDVVRAHARSVVRWTRVQVAVAALACGFAFVQPLSVLGILACLPLEMYIRYGRPPEIVKIKELHAARTALLDSASLAASSPAEPSLAQALRSFQATYKQVVEFDQTRAERKHQLRQRHYNSQRNAFLGKFVLKRGVIPGIGSRRIEALNLFGVYTAADVIRGCPQPANIPADLMQRVLNWPKDLQKQFGFDHLDRNYVTEAEHLNTQLDSEVEQLAESLRIKHQWIFSQLPTARERRKMLSDKLNDAAAALAEFETVWRTTTARFKLPG